MTETDAKTKMCPIIGITIAVVGGAIIGASTALKDPSGLQNILDKDDKNCIARKCMMWDRKRSDCGLKAR